MLVLIASKLFIKGTFILWKYLYYQSNLKKSNTKTKPRNQFLIIIITNKKGILLSLKYQNYQQYIISSSLRVYILVSVLSTKVQST